MAIQTFSKDIPSHLREPFTTRTGKGQVRSATELGRLAEAYEGVICITVRFGGGMTKRVGRFSSALDSFREDEDEHGNEMLVTERTVIWFQDSNNPLIIDWPDVREVVVEISGGSEF